MRQLMISLDKNILNKDSVVARRMVEYGMKNELFIIIPGSEKEVFDLSTAVHVQSTGRTSKAGQLFGLYFLGKSIIHNSRLPKPGTGGQAKFIIQNLLITTQDPFFTGLVGWLLKRKYKIKLEVQVHGDFFSDYYKKSGLMNLIRYYLGKWFVLKRADVIRVVGERVKNSLLKLGIEEEKIVVKPIAIVAEKIKNYQPKIDLRQLFPEADKVFICMGRLDPVKNISWLVDVFADVVKQRPRDILLIFGDGLERSAIQEQIDKLALPGKNIRLEKWTNDPIGCFRTADCLLFPSLSEGYGLVVMEAPAAGCPVIMNDVGVANYELKTSDKVKILPINDKEKWIQAILNI